MRPKIATSTTVRVRAPARLHLGFLDMNGALGRRFGSIGTGRRPARNTAVGYARRQQFGVGG